MNILLLGGTPSVRGGVELFIERAQTALIEIGSHNIVSVNSNTAYIRPASLGPMLRCILRLFRERKRPWDCVWLQYVNLPELLLLAICRLFGYRVLVTPHLGANWASQSNGALRKIGLGLLGLADGLALLSPIQADELALPTNVPQFLIKTFLPRSFPWLDRSGAACGELTLIHAGRLSAGKGTFLFIDICHRLKCLGTVFSARLIGSCEPETRSRIMALIEEHGLAGQVALSDPLPEPQLMTALSRADVLVHMSDIDSFPLIVLEAIACGVFPVCKDLPGARFMTGHYCGRLVEGRALAVDVAEDVAAFLAGVRADSLRMVVEEARSRVVADYSWEACVGALEAAIKALPGREVTGAKSRG